MVARIGDVGFDPVLVVTPPGIIDPGRQPDDQASRGVELPRPLADLLAVVTVLETASFVALVFLFAPEDSPVGKHVA